MIESLKSLDIQIINSKYNLISRSKEELIILTRGLMSKLPQRERLEFILKWISAKEALMEAGIYDRDGFIKRIEAFCKECIDIQYYIEPARENFCFYTEGEEGYSQSERASEFKELLETVIMFARNRNFDSSYKAFETLIECLQEADFNEEIFAIDNPRDYIDIDWC